MPYQFENRYRLTDEMLLEYVKQRNSRGLLVGSLIFSGINALLGLFLFHLNQPIWATALLFCRLGPRLRSLYPGLFPLP